MNEPVIAFIGAGHMGASLIGGLIQNGHSANALIAADPHAEKLNELATIFHIQTTQNNHEAVLAADVIVLAVKPQVMREVITPLREVLQSKKPLLLSIAAGIPVKSLERWSHKDQAIVRVMPNTPALIGHGASALFANAAVNETEHALAESIMRAVGITVWLKEESLMDAVTALSGSGPAYFFMIMDALQAAAESAGINKETARLLTLQTALGAAAMAMESELPLATLQQNVTSKGGTTEQAIRVLENAKLRDILKEAFLAAKQRSQELAHELGGTA